MYRAELFGYHFAMKPSGFPRAALACSLAVASLLFYLTGWLAEDAYINFRVIDNIVAGLGPVWNPGERVQVFTSPLWVGLVSLFTALAGSRPPVTALGVSLVCTWVAIGLAVVMGARKPLLLGLGLVCLFSSQSFLDYSSSGLENPLLHALAALICLLLWLEPALGSLRVVSALSFLCSLALFTRHDAIFFAGPALVYAALRRYRDLGWRRTALAISIGMSPFVAWELFSIVYYGAFVPNTAFAKLPPGYSKADLAGRGLTLLRASLEVDPGTVLSIVLAPLALFLLRSRLWPVGAVASAGTLMYVILVGGDFMLGRFISAIFVFSWLLVLAGLGEQVVVDSAPGKRSFRTSAAIGLALVVVVSSLWSLGHQFRSGKFAEGYQPQPFYAQQIADERSYYADYTGVRALLAGREHPWLTEGTMAKSQTAGRELLVAKSNIGMFGYTAGPDFFIIDILSLGNPFLARLPANPVIRPGHFGRPLPAGYVRSLQEGRNVIQDPLLAKLFDDIILATRAPLGAPGRATAIWRLNSRAYGDPRRIGAYAKTPGGVENQLLLEVRGDQTAVLGIWGDSVQPAPWSRTKY
jgi:arabinofuranosyltransferase